MLNNPDDGKTHFNPRNLIETYNLENKGNSTHSNARKLFKKISLFNK